MKDPKATIIIKAYEVIEKNLTDFLDIVPPEGDNRQTWSPKLVSILLAWISFSNSVSVIDTFGNVVDILILLLLLYVFSISLAYPKLVDRFLMIGKLTEVE